MQVYLHIGAHKTGTTAIQMTLAANRKLLRRRGILYPNAGRPELQHSYGHHALGWCLTRPGKHPDAWPDLRSELDSSRQQTAVISSECLDLITADEHFDHMRSHLADHDVRIVVYLRRQDEFLHAHYCTSVLYYRETREFKDFLRAPPTEPDYRVLLERWERAFGRKALIVHPYERSQLLNRDIVADFASRIGLRLPASNGRRPDRINRSYPRNVIESARRLRLAGVAPAEMGPLRELCARVYREHGHEADMLAPHDRRALIDAYAESNEYVARTYLGRDDGRLFHDLDIGDDRSWDQRYGRPLDDITTSIRELRDAFRQRAGDGS